MTTPVAAVVHRGPELLAEAVCARLVTALVDVQSAGRVPRLVLTGGSIATRIHAAVAASPARDAVDWRRVELWWGDERFVPPDDEERNELQARRALLDHVALDPSLVHPMPSTADAADVDEAAELYARALAAARGPEDRAAVPTFDVVMLGVGPEGHVASLFPERPALYDERAVVGVRGSPKPPPNRISMTMPTLCSARDVWFVVAGQEKARAVHLAIGGAGTVQVPAAGPHGQQRTLWLLDRDAASELPPDLPRLASP